MTPEQSTLLLVDDDEALLELLAAVLRAEGYEVAVAASAHEALRLIDEALPDLVVSDVSMPDMDGFELVGRLRASERGRTVPFVFLTALTSSDDLVAGLALGADDYLRKPVEVPELVARVGAKLSRPPVPSELLKVEPRTGLLSSDGFAEELTRESTRSPRSGREGHVGVVRVFELERIRSRLGSRAAAQLEEQIAGTIAEGAEQLESVGVGGQGTFLVLLPEQNGARARDRLAGIARSLAGRTLLTGEEHVRLTPAVGYAPLADDGDPRLAVERATLAAARSAAELDLLPREWTPELALEAAAPGAGRLRALRERLRLPLQLALTTVPVIAPFFAYVALYRAGWDVAAVMYLVVVAALLLTSFLVWVESFAALKPTEPPAEPGAPYPPATAVIAAYLPNEAATILDTLAAFRQLDYPDLQILLAYNTPVDLPIEAELRRLEQEDARFTALRVEGSTSKAQNVNAALPVARGAFLGVFDADHHPQADAFRRAWRWLSNGYDVVQGHCVVRNGDASWLTRLVAVEFEVMYAVNHPGRSVLHGFGIFGGSNGFWRTELLAETRMRSWMLTEDIDSSMRIVQEGHRIASDRNLVSRELAPATLSALWGQRMRWAQGWFQVAKRHSWSGLRSREMSLRGKIGLLHLLVWRELYPWISLQMLPIVGFYMYRAGGPTSMDWFVPVFVLTTLFMIATAPWQLLFAYRLSVPEIRRHRSWFLLYLVLAPIFYMELKNAIARVAQLKELMRERTWKVTSRAAQPAK